MRFVLRKIHSVQIKVRQFYDSLANKLMLIREGVAIQEYKINGILFVKNKGSINIGKGFRANSGVAYTPIGGDSVIRLITDNHAVLEIGNNVGISNSTIYCSKSIRIGNHVLIGNSCRIWDTNFHSIDPEERCFNGDNDIVSAPVVIEDKVFIGGGATILKGVTIGENSVIAAGSVVTKSIPSNQIWGGNPAQFIRNL
ncbi:acyltransferase [Psychroserpens sp. XS_ASV72]|uniref:acyltransferase n=1 Tax=Psychroserpens sp. XS_ASV72 TaxID=3241293 RepID=UPI0035169EA0